MLVLVNVLLVAAGALQILLSLERRRGPEGPVGFHLVTGPLALAQALGLGLWLGLGPGLPFSWPGWPVGVALPGLFVTMTLLPVAGLGGRRVWLPRLAVQSVVLGTLALANGAALEAPWLAAAGAVLVVAGGLIAYVGGVVLWVARQRQRAAAAVHEAERMDAWHREQAAWQLGEWQKLPADAELWQLVPFFTAQHPQVAAECQARLAAMPDLDQRMLALLGTGWGEHALAYITRHYPRSRAPLAAGVAKVLDKACDDWRRQLAGLPEPRNFVGNVLRFLDCALAVHRDGGDLTRQLRRWQQMLAGVRGMQDLAERLGQELAAKPTG